MNLRFLQKMLKPYRMHRNNIKLFPFIMICFCLFFMTIIILWQRDDSETTDEMLNGNASKPAVVIVIDKESQLESYTLAQSTLACYCKIYGYKLIKIVIDKSPEMQTFCPQKHIWFQRICVPMRILQQNPDIKYLFFFDADIGVINPNHRLEEYINPKYDLSFYERTFNYDIMSGSFIMKNTKFAIEFIEDWLKLEKTFIRDYGANDQAALHQMFLNRFYPNHPRKKECEKIWKTSDEKTIEGHTQFVGCARSIMDDKMKFENIIIYPKGSHKAWARDIWLTDGEWAPRDFLLHDMEEFKITNDPKQLKHDPRYFPNPFIPAAVFHSRLCKMPEGLQCWKYNSTYVKTDEEVDAKIKQITDEVRHRYLKFIKTL